MQGELNFLFTVEAVGFCNLECPSCPNGNWIGERNPRGFLQPSLLAKIMEKARSECNVTGVCLFNWGEPLLHPKLPELVAIVQNYDVPCFLSSNLNLLGNINALMEANPHTFIISVSGFKQATYNNTHKGGNVERLKKNMVALAEARLRAGSTTRIQVRYLLYLTNLQDVVEMKRFATDLGFEFQAIWAWMMPLEKVIAYLNDDPNEAKLSYEDLLTIKNLALPVKETVRIFQQYRIRSCIMRDEHVTLDYMGNVQLCCMIYDAKRFTIGPYLSIPLTDIQERKQTNYMCERCMDKGLNVYCVYQGPELNRLAIENILRHDAKAPGEVLNQEILKPTIVGMDWLSKDDALKVLLDVYKYRKDLKSAFPEVADGEYRRLMKWAYTSGTTIDTAKPYLRKFRNWYRKAWIKDILTRPSAR